MPRKPKPWFDNHNGKWYTTSPEGGRVLLSEGPKNAITEKLAYEEFYRYRSSLSSSSSSSSSRPLTVIDLFENYLRHIEGERSPRSYYNTKYYLEEFAHSFGTRLLSSLVAFDLTDWVKKREKKWKSSDTRSLIIRYIKGAFTWGMKQGILSKHPFQYISAPMRNRRKSTSEEEFLQVRKLFENQSQFLEVLDFLFQTGCRPSEVSRATWEGVNWERGVLILSQHKTRKKTNRERKIVLTEQVIALLKKIQERKDHPLFIFVSPGSKLKKPWYRGTIQRKIKQACEEAGVGFILHSYSLRHCYGTEAIKRGVPLPVVSELMGHTSTKTTEHYLHLHEDLSLLHQEAEKVRPSSPRESGGNNLPH